MGRPVPLVFQVTNLSGAEITLPVTGREPTADFRVFDARGRQIWSKLRGQIMLGSLRLYPLGPHARLTFRHTWDQRSDAGAPVPPGDYVIRGVLLTDAPTGLPSPPARIRLEP